MKKKYAQVMACVLSLALLISGCAGSGSAESTGNTNGTDNALAFVNPTDSTDGTLATDPTGTAATDPTGTGATEATGETADPTETSGAATEATSPATSGSSSGSSSSGSSGSSSGGTSSGSTGTGSSSSGSSNSGSGSGSSSSGSTGSNSGSSSGGSSSGSSSGSSGSGSSGSGSSSGGSSSGGSSSGGSGSGSSSGGSSSGSGSEATTPTTEATEPTTEPVVVHTHSYKKTVVSPTCTASGYTVYTCSCGDSYTGDYVDALGHDWECTGAVNEGYWLYQLICGCGKVFDTLEEWEVHSAEVYASGDLYTYYADCCHWASHDSWVVTRAGWEHTCTRCGEHWFEEATSNPYG